MTDQVTTWNFTPKFKIEDTVYIREQNSVLQMIVSSIQPIVQKDIYTTKGPQVTLTVRYFLKPSESSSSTSIGKTVAEQFVFATADEAFK